MNFETELNTVRKFSTNASIEVKEDYLNEIFDYLNKNIKIKFEETSDKDIIFSLGKLQCIVDNTIYMTTKYKEKYGNIIIYKEDLEVLLDSCLFIKESITK